MLLITVPFDRSRGLLYLLDRRDRKTEPNINFEIAVENHSTFGVDKPIVIWKLVTVERESFFIELPSQQRNVVYFAPHI